ncbi:glycosyltransferase family 2 protein [Vibrio ziniensis]|uniref:Glycosyltransferase family 2 protein n=1 Tax=Vibrio ziniensis TaxID=2711221 RepID=A0A6G7CLS6_9VIBR|nr:glycosyltransferase family 2 protein [Vibrio ziniensis]QIH42998.1 glycosyltransferase family 2 protein [Vibrio ziniensis]
MESVKVAIVIPAYNEAKTIKNVIDELCDELIGYSFTVIVVNDCSTDDTAKKATEAGAVVINLKSNQGYSGAINAGMQYATNEKQFSYVITMDADGQHHPQSVKEVFDIVNSTGTALVIGERPKYARFGEMLYGYAFSFLLGVKDPLCGLKAYSVEAFKQVGFFESYDSIGSELVIRLLQQGCTFERLRVKIRDRGDKPRFGRGIKVELRLFKSLINSVVHILKKSQPKKRSN